MSRQVSLKLITDRTDKPLMILSLFIILVLRIPQIISFAAPNLYNDLKEQQNHNKYYKLFRSLNTAVELDTDSNKEVIFNYNDLLNEYFMQSDEEAKSNITYYKKSEGESTILLINIFIILWNRYDVLYQCRI